MDRLIESYDNWRKNSSIFECYVKSTTLASLSTVDLEKVDITKCKDIKEENKESFKLLEAKIKTSLDNVLIISDLEAEENLDFSIMLNNNLSIKPILSINHIAHNYGLIGNNVIHNKLVNYSLKFKDIEEVKGYCFILDNGRYKDNDDYLDPLVFNNQYEVTEEELPHSEVLKMMNIDSLMFIYRNRIKEDIQKYLDYLKGEKINIVFIDLES
ncbi:MULTISPECIES: hypothetical protein [Clostridium]|uniref:Uncharacterized protein n=1 Tax=Clostridium cibarium TaxID=2762247 RepID=A0ABR8PSI7_9CLOT|nr:MULTISPECIES: hypothetical protein [Clostridium]MBD7911141.1 hypothetical protein [Clostridium cibarium]